MNQLDRDNLATQIQALRQEEKYQDTAPRSPNDRFGFTALTEVAQPAASVFLYCSQQT